ncbi:cell division protein FtsQ/DivIB [Salinicoccus albus]|uniref:cell division protein FtsQ/DivIB n=1 Tax=Salinicoccus albus TaxID=418756 RepID=UPI000371B478|nr:FtsQ-type POTRA domain-containing protein [Salinicoccus albus]
MKDRPDIDEMKKKLKGKRRESEEDPIASRLEGEPDEESEASEDAGEPVHTPESDTEEADAPVIENHADEPGDEDIETFSRWDSEINISESSEEGKGREKSQPAKKMQKTDFKRFFKKPKRSFVYTGLFILIILFSGMLLWYVFSDASNVKQVDISGNSLISDEELAERLQISAGDKMFSANLGRAEDNIELLPAIENVTVERNWWHGIEVNVQEFRPLAYVSNEGSHYPVLENRRVLRGYPQEPENAPIIHYFEGEEFDTLVNNLNDIEPAILEGISEIYYRPSDASSTRIHMFMNDGQEVVADYRTVADKMNHYIGMRDEIGDEATSGVIDLEIGSSFLPYGSEEAREIKQGIYEEPVQAGYIEDVNGSLVEVKDALQNFGDRSEASEE